MDGERTEAAGEESEELERKPEEEEGEEGSEGDGEGEDDEDAAGKVEGLTPKAQHAFEERVGKEVRRRKEAEERAAAAETELKAFREKWSGDMEETIRRAGLHVDYVEPEEAKAIARLEELKANLRWCKAHRKGYEGSDRAGDESMDEDAVARMRDRVEELIEDVGPRARAAMDRAMREIREDLAEGRKARKARKGKPEGDEGDGKGRRPKPPPLPDGGEARGDEGRVRRPVVRPMSEKEFEEAGGDEDALLSVYKKRR